MAQNAHNVFAEMRAKIAATEPHTSSLVQKAIVCPEFLTADDRLELAAQTGQRRLVLRRQAEMIAANQGITLPPPAQPLNTRKF